MYRVHSVATTRIPQRCHPGEQYGAPLERTSLPAVRPIMVSLASVEYKSDYYFSRSARAVYSGASLLIAHSVFGLTASNFFERPNAELQLAAFILRQRGICQ